MAGKTAGAAWLLGMVLMCAFPGSVLSIDGPSERVCKEDDLTGSFFLLQVTEKPPGEETQWHQEYPFHYLLFQPDHVYDYVASHHSIDSEPKLKKISKDQTVGITHTIVRKYTLDDTGLLNMTVDDVPVHSYRCLVLLHAPPKGPGSPGDIELLGYSKGNAQLTKLFKRQQW